MVETLQCPTCGAPLDFDPRSDAETVRCPFCANTAVLPRSTRPAAAPQIVVGQGRRSGNTAVTAGVIVAFVSVLVTGVVGFYAFHSYYGGSKDATRPNLPGTRSSLAPTPPPGMKPREFSGYTEPAMSFGSEGIGPGNFKDARSIAVDAQGRIYVGEYSGGRVQVFDSSGKFLTQWSVDPKMPLRGLAADRDGTVYVVQRATKARRAGLSATWARRAGASTTWRSRQTGGSSHSRRTRTTTSCA
jgi:hypothetical protein